jgi:hypothetical protein
MTKIFVNVKKNSFQFSVFSHQLKPPGVKGWSGTTGPTTGHIDQAPPFPEECRMGLTGG